MCGRYLTPEQADLEREWNLSAPADYLRSYNLAPSQLAPVILPDRNNQWALELLAWGYQPAWAKRAWINARSETVFSSRAFASAARRNRCLVPAIGWYEWQGARPPRQPWLFHLPGFRPFAFAGIWAPATDDRPATFAILTGQATPDLAPIHTRMPVVIGGADHQRWLAADCNQGEAEAIIGSSASAVSAYRVSAYVNKPEHNDAACIRPME